MSTVAPFMSVFNNLVVYDQHQALNTPAIMPDLAETWSWATNARMRVERFSTTFQEMASRYGLPFFQ